MSRSLTSDVPNEDSPTRRVNSVRRLDVPKAMHAGLIGGVTAYFVLVAGSGLVNVDPDLQMRIGMTLGLPRRSSTWMIGFTVYLAVSSVVAVFYAAAFEYITRRAGCWIGMAFSIVHAWAFSAFIGSSFALHPVAMAVRAGTGEVLDLSATTFFGLHLVFGGTVGAVYRRIRVRDRPLAAGRNRADHK